jgi:hypothetical protein
LFSFRVCVLHLQTLRKPSKHYICCTQYCRCILQIAENDCASRKEGCHHRQVNTDASTSCSQAASSLNQSGANPTLAVSLAGIGGIEDVGQACTWGRGVSSLHCLLCLLLSCVLERILLSMDNRMALGRFSVMTPLYFVAPQTAMVFC